jgi:universal stress protein A
MNIKRILYPTDLSACSLVALDYAARLASSFGAELHILHVDDLGHLMALTAHTAPSFVATCDRAEVKKQLKTIRPPLEDVRCEHHYVEGTPAEEIVAFAEGEKIDLIVMSSHGRMGLSRVFLGSVAELVLRRAKCPVLIVNQLTKVGCDDVAATKEIPSDTSVTAASA